MKNLGESYPSFFPAISPCPNLAAPKVNFSMSRQDTEVSLQFCLFWVELWQYMAIKPAKAGIYCIYDCIWLYMTVYDCIWLYIALKTYGI